MSGVSSTNLSANSYRSSGLSGMVSGMDTDSMVEKMLQGTQSKIDKQNAAKQRLEWKQSMYHNVISKINTLRGKYFDSSYDAEVSGNLLSGKFFNSMSSNVKSGDAVRIVGTSPSAFTGDMTVKVNQLASASKLTSTKKMSSNTIIGDAMDVDKIQEALSNDKELSFDLTLDGITKSITFSKEDFKISKEGEPEEFEYTAGKVKDVLDSKLSRAFGGYVTANMISDEPGVNKLSFSINISTDEPGHELKITGADAVKFGIEPGSSSLLQTSTKLGDISGISGKGYSFTINGEQFDFSADDTVGTMINTINSSTAGVKIAYSSTSDSFSLTASSTGAQYGIEIDQDSGNLLTVMFGESIAEGESVTSRALNSKLVGDDETGLEDGYTTAGASMTFNVNGKDYTFTLKKKDSGEYTKDEIEKGFNDWLTSTFGEGNISYTDGKLTTAAGYLVSFEKTEVTDENELERMGKLNLAIAMGFAQKGSTNAVTGDMSITDAVGLSDFDSSKFKFTYFTDSNGEEITNLKNIKTLTYDGTEYDASFEGGKLTLTLANGGNIDFSDTGFATYFGDKVTFGTGAMATNAVDAGTDAKVVINGVETSRSSNTFTFDGITMTATKESGEEATVIGTVRDTDKIVDAVKSFVDDYNKMVDELYGYITEDSEYREYAPLTSAQKKDMSDDEIEKWTEKAKTGLLRSDNDISSFLQSMRSAFYTKVESAGVAAYSIGIETTENSMSGRLTVNETLLRKVIASSPDTVEKIFTDPENGLATQLNRTCEDYAKMSMAKPGVFVQKAGADGYTAYSKMNNMYKELGRINDKLKDLQSSYEKERTRYWKKFNAMESIMAMYSSQSAMISQSFSSEY